MCNLTVNQWEKEPEGFYLEVRFSHGDADAVTTERLFFENTEAGLARLGLFQAVYPDFAYYCTRYLDETAEFIVEKSAAKAKLPYDNVFELLEPLIREDVTGNGMHVATPTGYCLRKVDANGVSWLAVL